MKIEIGCGLRLHKGYKTIDVEEYAHPDFLGDFRDMEFKDVEEIRSHHLLEHFGRDEALEVLRLWSSWLMPGGKLIVETPDFEYICKDFEMDKYWMSRHAYGSQEAEWAFHRSGWWEARFRQYLPKAGFEIEEIRRSRSREILPNILVIARKR